MVLLMLIKLFLAAAPYVVAGFLMAGAIHQWVSPDLLRRHLGRKGGMPLLKAVGIGSLLPICSCGTVPLGVGLYQCGAAVGTILSFMTSSPVLSPVIVLIAFKMLGAKLTISLLGTALVGSFLIGAMGNWLLPDKRKSMGGQSNCQYKPVRQIKAKHPLLKWLHWSFFDLGAHVSVDLVIGLGLATLIMGFLPVDFVANWLSRGQITSLILILVLSLPVYSCSVPSVPVVQSLLILGVSPGAAVVYLIAGPATNMGELNAIRTNMGFKTAAYYAAALVVVALTAGIITDQFIFHDYQYVAETVNGQRVVQQCCVPILYNQSSIYAVDFASVSLLEWVMGGILAVVMVIGLFHKIREFLVNPCQSCLWKDYAEGNQCIPKCHIRRKYDFLIRFIGSR